MAAPSNMHNLTTLIKRLEAATSRLEDISTSAGGPLENGTDDVGGGQAGSVDLATIATPLPPPKKTPPPLPPAIEGFDTVINEDVTKFANLSDSIGGFVSEQAAAVLRAFAAERKFLILTTKAKKPEIHTPAYMTILRELQEDIGAVSDIRVANRGSPFFGHLTTVSEGIALLGWVTVDPKPAEYITEFFNAAKYHGDRVQKEYKNKDQSHIDWLNSYYTIFRTLSAYVNKHYPNGLTWNNKDGIDALEALEQLDDNDSAGESGATPTPNSSTPAPPTPTPPPPPPMAPTSGPPPPAKGAAPDMGAVFNQLSKGEAVTSGLRKVDPSQQTHKNPSLRTTSIVTQPNRSNSLNSNTSSSRGKSPMPARKPESMRTKKPPRKVLEGNKWIIENYDNPGDVVEIEAERSHSILVTKCTKTTLRVIGKANAISIDSSNKFSLIIDSLVSGVDVIKTPRFEMQVLGALPTIMLDQVDGATVYLSRESLSTEIFTSKCTAVNINVPGKSDEDDYRECPMPEQIKTVIRNGVPVSEIVEHAG